jgi:GAF domain-containing protein
MREQMAGGGSYVDRVRADTRQYAQELLEENEKLRGMLAALGEQASVLRGELSKLQQELEHYRDQGSRMEEQLARAETDSRRFVDRYLEVERENSNLANLYVASYRLHCTLERSEVLAVIHEILANLVGCEEALVLEASDDGSLLTPVSSQGIELPAAIPVGRGLIGRAAQDGEIYLAPSRDGAGGTTEEASLTACVPLKLGERTIGALALFRLLPQKTGFEPIDRELFDLLATHAAMALYCSKALGSAATTRQHA